MFKTPPTTRKRKLDITNTATSTSQDSQPRRKASKTKHKEIENVEAALPATPQTLSSDRPMDSDDDFASVASSQDFDAGEDSSVDFGAGRCIVVLTT